MRTSITAVLLSIAGLTEAASGAAQAPPPPAPPPAATSATSSPAPATAAPPASAAAPPAPATPPPPPMAMPSDSAAPPASAPPPSAAPPPSVAANWYDKFTADAFVDAYGSINYNFPKPAGPIAPLSPIGGNGFRALDTAEWFSLNWAGVNVSYAADPIGFTLGARVGPGAVTYHAGTSDEVAGLQYVKQAFATWKATSKFTLDFGKWDQPYGSEVADSQLNMNYTRTLQWWYMQPLFFTGLRANYAIADQLNVLAFAANGWNNSIDINRGKAFGAQVMIKPADALQLYVGYVASPEQPDTAIAGATVSDVADANSHWRHLVDLVLDINPTKELRILFNANYRTESGLPNGAPGPGQSLDALPHSAIAYSANLVVRYSFTDAFYASLRGDYFHDEHGDLLVTGQKTDAGDGTLTLAYTIGSHLALMLDNRFDDFNIPVFYKGGNVGDTTKTQFTTTLGVIASTK